MSYVERSFRTDDFGGEALMGSSTRDERSSTSTEPSATRLRRACVALLAGGTAALVALLFVPVVTVTTSVALSLTQLSILAVVAGLIVTADSARQPSPRLVVVRTSYLVTTFVVVGGLALGVYVWTLLSPAQSQEGQLFRYAPLVPIVSGLVVGGLVGGFGALYRRRTEPYASE